MIRSTPSGEFSCKKRKLAPSRTLEVTFLMPRQVFNIRLRAGVLHARVESIAFNLYAESSSHPPPICERHELLKSTAHTLADWPKHSVPTAAIAGGVAGGLVLVLMVFTIPYLLTWKPRHKKASNHDPAIAEEAEPNQSPTSDEESEKAELDTSEPFVELPDPRDEKREMLVIENRLSWKPLCQWGASWRVPGCGRWKLGSLLGVRWVRLLRRTEEVQEVGW
jgi:hypothetical protein